MIQIRKAAAEDLSTIERIYEDAHREEESGRTTTGWGRGVYPVRKTAEDALKREELYVLEDEKGVQGTAIINHIQVDVYEKGEWEVEAKDDELLVIHTLVISALAKGKGYGPAFVEYYERMAREKGCRSLRLDTNARNKAARKMYRKLGCREIGIVPTVFNGIEGVDLVLIEKDLSQ